MKRFQVGGLVLLFVSVTAQCDSMIRFKCDGKDVGAELFADGQPIGTCPADVLVPKVGAVMLSARKMVNADYEQVFAKQIILEDGVAQRILVTLSEARMTAEAVRLKRIAETAGQLRRAEAGELAAMDVIAERYTAGDGIEKSTIKAGEWRKKAESARYAKELASAEAGDIVAMKNMISRYQDAAKAQYWKDKLEEANRVAQLAAQEAERKLEITRQAFEIQQKAASKQVKINSISYAEFIGKGANGAGCKNEEVSCIVTTAGPMMTTGTIADLFSLPTKSYQIQQIRKEAVVRPSTWAKPNSMIARASRQQDILPVLARLAEAQ